MKNIIFYDSDCISSFLIINKPSLLKKLFEKINVPKQVYDELSSQKSPKIIRKNVKKLKDEKFIEIIEIDVLSHSFSTYQCLINGYWGDTIGNGEASVLALAIENDGIVASNNLSDIIQHIKEYNLGLITTPIILTKLFEKELISKKEANDIWNEMKKRNRKLPSKSFNEYYSKQFKKDYEEFNCEKYYKKI